MPKTPRWVGVAGAAVAVLGVMVVAAGRRRTGLSFGGVGTAAMLATCAGGVPWSALLVIIWALNQLTGADSVFELDLNWLALFADLVPALAVLLMGWWGVRTLRGLRGHCPDCGRDGSGAPPPPSRLVRRALPWLAVAAAITPLPYGGLKLLWGLGLRLGLPGDKFGEVAFLTPGFGDTAALTAFGVVAAILMGLRIRQRVVRTGLVLVGLIGSVMLLPTGGIGLVIGLLPALFGQRALGDAEIAGWVYGMVYLSFLLWGIALSLLTVVYVRATPLPCRRHRVDVMLTPSGGHPVDASDDTFRRAETITS